MFAVLEQDSRFLILKKHYELPIFKSTLDFCIYVDAIVKNQDKYHKYGIGSELREASRAMFYLVSKIKVSKGKKILLLQELLDKCEETKAMLYLAKSIKAFKSFNQFEYSSKLTIDICRQAQGWLNSASARVTK